MPKDLNLIIRCGMQKASTTPVAKKPQRRQSCARTPVLSLSRGLSLQGNPINGEFLSSDRRRVPIEFRLTVNVELRSTASSHQLFEFRSICSSSDGQQRRVLICSTSDRWRQRVSICSSKWGFEEKEKSEYVLKETNRE